jgi:Flp pilus assembly protein TadD
VSKALAPLRAVVHSLAEAGAGRIPGGADRKRILRAARQAGPAAVPVLMRSLASASDGESSWAYWLLARIGDERVLKRLSALLQDPEVADQVKARALGLLSDLGAPMPREVQLRDPDELLRRSVRDLVGSLDDDSEIRQAVDLIRFQVPEVELPAFAAEVMRHGGERAIALLTALRASPGLTEETVRALEEVQRAVPATRAELAAQEALERGLEYLETGRPEAARRRLMRFVRDWPEHAEGQSALGVCLLQLGDWTGAQTHLREAARLEPNEPLHRWNLAAAAKQADRLGGAYLALREYLSLTDDGEGAADRHREARAFVRAYEKMLRDAHPGVSLGDYLRGEELFARAYAALSESRADEACAGFEAVLALVPRHYPSWGNLGAAYLAAGRFFEARRALEYALELKPDYTHAKRNLALVDQALRP